MKIKSIDNFYRGKALNMCGVEVKFNAEGVAEVDDKVGGEIVKGFPDIYEADKMPKAKEVEKDLLPEEVQAKFEEYTNKVASQATTIKNKEQKIATLEGELKGWKDLYNEAKEELNIIKAAPLPASGAGTTTPETTAAPEAELTPEEMEAEIRGKGLTELRKIAKQLNVYDAVEDKTSKDSIADTIIEATK